MKKIMMIAVAVIAMLFGLSAAQDGAEPASKQVSITFIGHACFAMTTTRGTSIVCDPSGIGEYPLPDGLEVDIVTASHEHFDHNNVGAVGGDPIVLHGMKGKSRDGFDHTLVPIDSQFSDVHIHNVECHHFPPDDSPAMNAVFVYAFDGITVAHLGDIGVVLTDEQAEAVGPVDILMIPTGGKYTLELPEVEQQIAQLQPKVVIPMHYATDVADFVPNTGEDFLKGKDNVLRIDGHTWSFDPATLPDELTYVAMEYYAR